MGVRPIIKIELTQSDKIIEILGWIFIGILWLLTVYFFSLLPATIPTHFNAYGKVDDYGSKATILILPIISSVLFIGLTILNKYPQIFNFPSEITEENALKQYTLATRMIRILKLSLALVFSLIFIQICLASSGITVGFGILLLPVTLLLIFVPIGYFVIKMFRSK